MNIAIYTPAFLDSFENDRLSIGGIETLISYLLPVIADRGWTAIVYQCSAANFESERLGIRIVGLSFPAGTPIEKILPEFKSRAKAHFSGEEFIEVFAADHFSIKSDSALAISVQNGVWWDQPIERLTGKRIFHSFLGERVFRLRKQFQMLQRFENCQNHVCVDHNFVNWYRTCRGELPKGNVWILPNPAPLLPWDERRNAMSGPVRIIFARRLVLQKGTRLISEVFRELLDARPGTQLTIAGDGPEEAQLRRDLDARCGIRFIKYRVEDVNSVLREHDISVVPSLLSEGTCLSVAEAMAAGCAVVATNFGGMTNQIVDGFNGLLVLPNKVDLLSALLRLIDDRAELCDMQRRGWSVASVAFSLDLWRRRWAGILETTWALRS